MRQCFSKALIEEDLPECPCFPLVACTSYRPSQSPRLPIKRVRADFHMPHGDLFAHTQRATVAPPPLLAIYDDDSISTLSG